MRGIKDLHIHYRFQGSPFFFLCSRPFVASNQQQSHGHHAGHHWPGPAHPPSDNGRCCRGWLFDPGILSCWARDPSEVFLVIPPWRWAVVSSSCRARRRGRGGLQPAWAALPVTPAPLQLWRLGPGLKVAAVHLTSKFQYKSFSKPGPCLFGTCHTTICMKDLVPQ